MPGLVPGIHVLASIKREVVDGRDIGERKRRRPSDGYAPAMTEIAAAQFGSWSIMLGNRHAARKIRLRVSQNAAAMLFEPGTVDIR